MEMWIWTVAVSLVANLFMYLMEVVEYSSVSSLRSPALMCLDWIFHLFCRLFPNDHPREIPRLLAEVLNPLLVIKT